MSAINPIRDDARKDPDLLQTEIDATRQDLNRTLDALQARLSPGQLLDHALGLVRDHGGEMARNLGVSVKENPVPMMLTGIGLMWLMTSQRSATAVSARPTTLSPEDVLESVPASADSIIEGAPSEGLADKTRARVSAARERVAGVASSLSAGVSEARESTRQRMEQAREGTRYQMERAREGFSHMLHEQPLVLGALGVALGAAIGAVLPPTRREDELFGEARDRTLERAKQIGSAKPSVPPEPGMRPQ